MKRKFKKLIDGEWSNPSRLRKTGFYLHRIKCCDCGLVHLMQYKITTAGKLRFRAWRESKWI